MCSQYTLTPDLKALAEEFDVTDYNPAAFGELLKKAPKEGPYTIYPRYPAPVLLPQKEGMNLKIMHFGLVPFFEKNEKPKMVFHNARLESIFEKPSFKKAILERRCLVPMEQFHEYVTDEHDKAKRITFSAGDSKLMSAAGIWELWESPAGKKIPTFSILTSTPHPFIEQHGHDRTPLFVPKDMRTEWISPMKKDELGDVIEKLLTRQKFEFRLVD